jgi:hypothetical protein
MAAAWAADPQTAFGPFQTNAANAILIRISNLMIVPQAYVSLILGETLTPREVYLRLSTYIFVDNRALPVPLFSSGLLPCLRSYRSALLRATKNTIAKLLSETTITLKCIRELQIPLTSS